MADLIDRSELKKGLCAECTLLHGKCPEKNGGECDWDAIGHINSAPRVDAEPVIYGNWIVDFAPEHYDCADSDYTICMCRVRCSACNAVKDEREWRSKLSMEKTYPSYGIAKLAYSSQIDWINSTKTKYCPNCGARMK